VRPDEGADDTSPGLTPDMEQAMPKDDAFNNTAEHPDDIFADMRAGFGVLQHLAAARDVVEPEELNFVVSKPCEALTRLQLSLSHERKEPQL